MNTWPMIQPGRINRRIMMLPAIALYRKNGFVEEGRRIQEVKMADGRYVDDILMYKLVKD